MKVAVIGANGRPGTKIVKVFGDAVVITFTQTDIETSDIGSAKIAFANYRPDNASLHAR